MPDTGTFKVGQRNNAYNNRHGGEAASLINPTHGMRDEQHRRGMKPKDHHKENIMAMREMAEKARIKQMQKDVEPEPFKIERFKNVEPRALKSLANPKPATAPAPKPFEIHGDEMPRKDPKQYLKAHSKTQEPASAPTTPRMEPSGVSSRRRELSKPAVPTAAELAALPKVEHVEKDLITNNAKKVIKTQPRMAPCDVAKKSEEERLRMLKEKQGKIPAYLVERKIEFLEQKEKERLMKEMEDVPPGMVMMPEQERLDTLSVLSANRVKLQKELDGMSITSDTLRHRQHKADLEKKLKEIDDALTVFSRKKVFIAP